MQSERDSSLYVPTRLYSETLPVALLPALALYGLWRFVSEPPFTPPDKNFALRYASIIHAALTPQGNRYWVPFGVFHVTGLQVIGLTAIVISSLPEASMTGRPSSSIFGITHLQSIAEQRRRAAGGTTALSSRCRPALGEGDGETGGFHVTRLASGRSIETWS